MERNTRSSNRNTRNANTITRNSNRNRNNRNNNIPSIPRRRKSYADILSGYNQTSPANFYTRKRKTEKFLAQKFCACIKKLDPRFHASSIGICTRSVFQTKGLPRRHDFSCRNRRYIAIKPVTRRNN
jgi:hypothetical protein